MMSDNNAKYLEAFRKIFNLDPNADPSKLEYQGIPEWDSVGHLELITHLEEQFQVRLEVDDVIDFSSAEIGKTILGRYGIEM